MRGFYIEKLIITGEDKEPSVLEFCKGLNFIVGPSNSGKSYVMESIDYLFGFEDKLKNPFRFEESYGYDCFSIHTYNERGKVIFTRKLNSKKIMVDSTDTTIDSGIYSIDSSSKKNINSVWLKMMGIYEPHKILARVGGAKQNLTWRSMMHMFFLKQDYVSRTSSVLISPSTMYQDTPSKASLLFLLTGEDGDKVVTQEDKKLKTAKKEAVMTYIRETIKKLAIREGELTDLKETYENIDLQKNMEDIVVEIEDFQNQMNLSVEESKKLMNNIYKNNNKLSECSTISSNFNKLKKQYKSEIERLTFVVEGEFIKNQIPVNKVCPFCENDIKPRKNESYVEGCIGELNHIKTHLKELEKAQQDLLIKGERLKSSNKELESKKHQIDLYISEYLAPKISDLEKKLEIYRKNIEISKEIQVVKKDKDKYREELTEKEMHTDSDNIKYQINEYFSQEDIIGIENEIIEILKKVKILDYSLARLSMTTFDLEIDGKHKSKITGGGYCGVLNTIISIAVVNYLNEKGKYTPNFLMVDSAVSQLSEPNHKEKESGITSGFVDYLLSNANNGQKIIIEHKEKFPIDIQNSENVRVIEFTKDKQDGRYGLLHDVE